ncbi:uncharacterized protein [Spinacia oleracea]|uniref:Aminotransferase-like plant mobile domain-containing protein n=1 Tax=Spinacia oleracea TaxID=3562 RepID=A0ABM3QKG6_SPIOL|nr:uncharacterized protein LOC130460598 [Spinacia oleracea]
MVYFKYHNTPGEETLSLMEDANSVDGAHFRSFPPVIGPFANIHSSTEFSGPKSWYKESRDVNAFGGKTPNPVLVASHHRPCDDACSFQTLSTRLSRKETKWSSSPKFGVEPTYIPLYWEWLEDVLHHSRRTLASTHILDAVYASMYIYKCNSPVMQAFCESWCPTTNTLHTSVGEMSISLWDIYDLGGLPVTGLFYDEVVPSAVELEGSDDEHSLYLPYSCKYLFMALHYLSEKHKVTTITFETWCDFWFRGASKYFLASGNKKSVLPTLMKDFSSFNGPRSWSHKMYEAFRILRIPEAHHRQTYLAAFLSCWLCAFVLPVSDLGCIRPGSFKPASFLASGKETSLAIPVLASIYHGLSKISNSPTPGKHRESFPAQYVYAWTAKYFRSHHVVTYDFVGAPLVGIQGLDSVIKSPDAKSLVSSGKDFNWLANSICGNSDEKREDGNHQPKQFANFFISMRSCFLTLRFDNNYVVEPYSPHRFGRQFGFHQDVPGELVVQTQNITREHMYYLFQSSIRLHTRATFLVPCRTFNAQSRVTPSFTTWWNSVVSLNAAYASRTPSLTNVRSKKRKERKGDDLNTSPKDKAAKTSAAPRKVRVRLPKSSTISCPPKETSSKCRDESRRLASRVVSNEPSNDENEPSGDEHAGEPTILDDIFAEDYGPELSPEEIENLQSDANIAVELTACENTFVSLPEQQFIDDVVIDTAPTTSVSTASTESPSFNAQDMITKATNRADRYAASLMINEIKDKLMKTPLAKVHELAQEFEQVFSYVRDKKIDISAIESFIKGYIGCGSQLHHVRLGKQGDPTLNDLEQRSLEIETSVQTTTIAGKAEEERMQALHKEIDQIQQEQAEHKRKLNDLAERADRLLPLISESEEKFQGYVIQKKEQENSLLIMKENIVAAKEVEAKLAEAEKQFGVARDALQAFKFEP